MRKQPGRKFVTSLKERTKRFPQQVAAHGSMHLCPDYTSFRDSRTCALDIVSMYHISRIVTRTNNTDDEEEGNEGLH